jgi:hypothetical protein
MALYQVLEFVMHAQGGYHTETHLIAATTLAEACRNWNRETQRKPHEFLFISSDQHAAGFGSVLENMEAWKPTEYSETQFTKWRLQNVGKSFLRLADAMRGSTISD